MIGDEILLWGLSALLSGGIVLPYFLAFRRRRRTDRTRKEEASRLGVDRPAAQYPFVDPRHCIGCGACVAACPEGDVLGVVGGTATVINGLRCVGHGRCEEACPVGAIEVGLGDLKSRTDIPRVDEWNETTVPGLFIVGELGGLALVKNAVAQAGKAMERIAVRAPAARARTSGDAWDVVVVGAGPAGLAAAAAARARRLSCLVLEQERDLGGTIYHYPRRKLVLVQAIELPLWGRLKEDEYAKERLLAIFEDLVRRHGLDVRFGARVVDVRGGSGLLSVRTTSDVYLGRFVVLALGRRGTPRKLGVPGEELPKVMYQLQDTESYRDQRVLIVGGGDSAVEAAIGLARDGRNEVALSYRRERLVRIKRKNEERFETLVRRRSVRTLFSSEVDEVGTGSVRLKTASGPIDIPNDYVFVLIGGEPPFAFLRQVGVTMGGQEKTATLPALA